MNEKPIHFPQIVTYISQVNIFLRTHIKNFHYQIIKIFRFYVTKYFAFAFFYFYFFLSSHKSLFQKYSPLDFDVLLSNEIIKYKNIIRTKFKNDTQSRRDDFWNCLLREREGIDSRTNYTNYESVPNLRKKNICLQKSRKREDKKFWESEKS